MAFQATQQYDNLLLRTLGFRTTGNAAISSQYALFATGTGQTYWSNAVLPSDLSTVSTAYGISVSTLSTSLNAVYHGIDDNFSSLYTALALQSSQLESTNQAIYSSVSSLLRTESALSTSFGGLSNNFNFQSNRLTSTVANNYVSSIQFINSSLFGISSISTFYSSISAINLSLTTGLSTISTTLALQSLSTASSLTYNYTMDFRASTLSTTLYLQEQLSTLTGNVSFQTNLSTFSSIITRQLLSTTTGLNTVTTANYSTILRNVSTVYNTIVVPMTSTVSSLVQDVMRLDSLSTSLYSTTYGWISTFMDTSQALQDIVVYSTLHTTNKNIEYLAGSTTSLMYAFSSFSSTTASTIAFYTSTNALYLSSIAGISHEYSVIQTSSVLASIYDSFMALEGSTSSLVGSTIATGPFYQSSVYYSTSLQNTSIAQAYFLFTVSTLYASTLSTLITSTVLFVSTAISTLYSTGSVFLLSTLTSSATGVSEVFLSTISSLTQAVVLSSGTQCASSLSTYMLIPFEQTLSTFSTNQYIAISSYTFVASQQNSSQSAMTSSVGSNIQSLYTSSIVVVSSLSTQFAATSALLSSFWILNAQQASTQAMQFSSTLLTYGPALVSTMNSTTTSIYTLTATAANSTVVGVEASTLIVYNAYMASVNSTTSLSTLYTTQTFALTGTNYTAALDMANYRNFTISVYGLLDGGSNYSITYLSNNLQSADYYSGVITIDVSTIGTSYSVNAGALNFDTYRWGIPTSVFGNVYPLISNADYLLQYGYTILNKSVYTSLLGVYPRIATQSPSVSTLVQNIFDTSAGAYRSNIVWRDTPVLVSWSNYSFFPFDSLGGAPFSPTVQVDVLQSGSIVAQYGPYTMPVSSATIVAPSFPGAPSFLSTTVVTYVTGDYTRAVSTVFVSVQQLPFSSVQLRSPGYPNSGGSLGGGFLGGTELVAITRNGAYPLYGTTPLLSTQASAFTSFNNNPLYRVSNLTNGTLNAVGSAGVTPSNLTVGASNIVGQVTEVSAGTPDFYVNLPSYFTSMSTLQTFGAAFTFTFSSITASYSFLATTISNVSGSLYRLTNPSIVKAAPTFTSGTCRIQYSYTAVPAISTTTGYTPSSFIGPITTGVPENAVYVAMSPLSIASGDLLSTLTFYNLPLTAPVPPTQTANTQITTLFSNNGFVYASTMTTTAAYDAQIFRF